MFKFLRRLYYRGKLHLWAILNLPKNLHVGNTNFKIPAHNWMVAIPTRIDTTEVRYFGRFRNFARYFYEPVEYQYFMEIVSGKRFYSMLVRTLGGTALFLPMLGSSAS